jgi:hypothetical protein
MESLLWGIDLIMVVLLCYWALRADTAEAKAEAEAERKSGKR